MKYTTVLFDLDGTLLNTLDDIRDSVNHVLTLHSFPERSREQVRMAVGNGAAKLLERSLPEGRNTPDFDALLAEYRDWYLAHNLDKTAPYEGVHQLLRSLVAREYKVAVVSNKPDANTRALVRHFFGDVVSVAIGEKDGVRPKPAPDTVNAALRELASYNWESVYVGDSEVDLKTAYAARMDCISVAWGFRSRTFLEEAGAKTVVTRPMDILKLV